MDEALASVRAGENPELTTRQKHTRECFVVAQEGADKARIEEEIKTMPNYFDEYDTTVHFIEGYKRQGQDLMLWGIEGVHWTKDGDTYVPNEEILDGLQNNLDKTREETGITRWTWFVRNASTHKDGSPSRMQDVYKRQCRGFPSC